MPDNTKISVFDLIGDICVSTADAQRVYEKIAPDLRRGADVLVSFDKVDTVISSFLNVAIGQLYGEFEEHDIKEHLCVQGLSQDYLDLLGRVTENAKAYFKNIENFHKAWSEEIDANRS